MKNLIQILLLLLFVLGPGKADACSPCHPGCDGRAPADDLFWQTLSQGNPNVCKLVDELAQAIEAEYSVQLVFKKAVPSGEEKSDQGSGVLQFGEPSQETLEELKRIRESLQKLHDLQATGEQLKRIEDKLLKLLEKYAQPGHAGDGYRRP